MKYPNLKTFLTIFIFTAAALLPARINAQSIDLITFVPLKIVGDGSSLLSTQRSYQFISTKSRAQFAQATGNVIVEGTLLANSALLDLRANYLNYPSGETFLVRNSVFTRPGVSLFITNLQLGGFFYKFPNAGPNDINDIVNLGLTQAALSGRRIDMKGRPLKLNRNLPGMTVALPDGQAIYVDGIALMPPPVGCTVNWHQNVQADYYDAGGTLQSGNFNVLRCS